MSKIQINAELDSTKPNELKIVAKMLLELAGAPTISEAASDQQWAEEVNESLKEEAAPKKRASRAKPKTEQDVEASEAEEPKAEEPKAEETKTEETKTEETKTEETKTEEAEEPKAEAASEEGIKLDDLRASLSLKVKSHRDEIKAKLTELGASNLTTLDAGKYADMNDFLKGLK